MSVDVVGADKAINRLIQIGKNSLKLISELEVEADYCVRDMQSIAPVKSGFLRDNIVSDKLPDGAFVHSKADYSQAVEHGTSPHPIYPVRAKALHWVNNQGEDVFAKSVWHPGTKPRPYFYPAVYESIKNVKEKVLAVMREYV